MIQGPFRSYPQIRPTEACKERVCFVHSPIITAPMIDLFQSSSRRVQ
jgi:hypothetical protein